MRKKTVNRVLALLMSAVLMAGNIPVYATDADEQGTDQVNVAAAEDDANPEEELSADTPEEDPTVPEEETDTSFEDAVDIRGDCFIEDHTIKSYSGNHKAILIPETYWDNNTHDHREVSAIAEGVFRDHTELEEVYFAKNTNHIGAYAFSGTSIKKITFLGAMSNIGSYAFANCPELEEVVFQADDEITIDNWGDGTFRNCPKLKKITLSNKCVSLPDKFAEECPELEEVVWPAELRKIGAFAFRYDEKLTTSDFSKTSLRITEQGAFHGCSKLDLPVFPDTMENIGWESFQTACTDESVTPGTLIIPKNVKEIGPFAFARMGALRKVKFEANESGKTGSTITFKVNGAAGTFSNCKNLLEVELSDRVNVVPSNCFRDSYNLIFLSGATAVTQIDSYAFLQEEFNQQEIVLKNCNSTVTGYDWESARRVVKDVASAVLLSGEYMVETGKSLDLGSAVIVLPEGSEKPKLTWRSNAEEYVKVDNNGKVTGVKEGSARIYVKTADGLSKADFKVSVKKGESPAPEPKEFTEIPGGEGPTDSQPVLTKETQNLTLIRGQKFDMADTGWKSSSKKVVSVSKKKVAAKKEGTAQISFGEYKIDVKVLAPVLSKSEKSVKLGAGESGQLTLAGAKAESGEILFTGAEEAFEICFDSSNPDVAVVNEDGEVLAVAKGSATVTAYINGVAFKYSVKVSESTPAKERTLHINVGKSKSVKIKGLKKTVWTVSGDGIEGADDIVKIKGAKIKAEKTGEATLVCEGFTLHVYVEDPSIVGSSKAYKQDISMAPEEDHEIVLKALSRGILYKSNKNSVAYVDNEGVIHARSKGTAKITAKVNGKTVTVTVNVK